MYVCTYASTNCTNLLSYVMVLAPIMVFIAMTMTVMDYRPLLL